MFDQLTDRKISHTIIIIIIIIIVIIIIIIIIIIVITATKPMNKLYKPGY